MSMLAFKEFPSQINSLDYLFTAMGTQSNTLSAAIDAYSKAAMGATGATALLKGGIAALGAVIKAHPIIFAVSAIASAVTIVKRINDSIEEASQKAIESSQKIKDSFGSSITNISDNLANLKGLKEEFDELSKGVDTYGNNISLTSDKHDRYKEIVKTIIGISPELIDGYDDEGNAIANKNGLLEKSIALMEEEQRIEKEKMVTDGNLWTVAKGDIEKIKDYWDGLGDLSVPGDLAYSGVKIVNGEKKYGFANQIPRYVEQVIGVEFDEWNDGGSIKYIAKNIDEVYTHLDEILNKARTGLVDESGNVWDGLTEKQIASLKSFIISIKSQTDDIKEVSTGFNEYLQLIPQSMNQYSEIGESSKDFLTRWIKSFNIDESTTESEIKDISEKIRNFTRKIANDKNIELTLDAAVKLDTDINSKDLTVSEYQSSIDDFLSQLETLDAETQTYVKIAFGIDSDENKWKKTVDEKISRVKNILKDEFDDKVYDLSMGDLEIAFSSIKASPDSLSFDELQAEINKYNSNLETFYNKWQSAKESTDERDKYKNIGDDYKSVKELINQGWVSDSEVEEYLNLLLIADERTKNNITDFDKLTSKISGTKFSIMDFFQYDKDDKLVSDGLYNFLDAVKSKLGEEFVRINKEGEYSFDFSGEKIDGVSKALGMSVEAIQILEHAMIDAGFDVIFDPTFEDIDNVKTGVKECIEVLKELKTEGKINSDIADFNLHTSDIEDAKTQIEQAKELLKEFLREDGSVNLDLEGAKEASTILASLIYRKSDLANPTLMNIDVGKAESDIEYAISLLQQFKDANANLELQTALGMDTTEAQKKVDGLLNDISKNQTITGVLNIDTTSIESVLNGISSQNLTAEVLVTAGLDSSKIAGYIPEDKTATVTYKKDSKVVDKYNPPNFTRIVTFKKDSYDVDIYKPKDIHGTVTYTVNQTGEAGAQGTAFKSGSWGTKNSGVALGGELGQELVVRNGKFFTIGDESAELFAYKKNDIIFNAEQTEQILKNGKINRGLKRGRAFSEGTAFEGGSTGYGGSRRKTGGATHNPNSSTSKNKSKNTNDKSVKDNKPQKTDWIETLISRLERTVEKFASKATDTTKRFDFRLESYASQRKAILKQIEAENKAKAKYQKEANKVGLSSALKKKVREGSVDIKQYSEETQKLIEEYQTWYEKSLACSDAVDELNQSLSEISQAKFELIATKYDKKLSYLEHRANKFNLQIEGLEASGIIVGEYSQKLLRKNKNADLNTLNEERKALVKQFNSSVRAGTIKPRSEAWYDMLQTIRELDEEIMQTNNDIIEINNAIRQVKWDKFDYGTKKLTRINKECEFFIELLSNEKLVNENGEFTSEGKAVAAIHFENLELYEADVERYAKEIAEVEKEINKTPFDEALLERKDELIDKRRESIQAAQKERDAIVNLAKESAEAELKSIEKIINAYSDALDKEKEMRDYKKSVSEKTSNIADIKKQLAAYELDTSDEGRMKAQQLRKELKEAEEELEDTEYDKQLSDQKQMLETLYENYENAINIRLEDTNGLISNVAEMVKNSGDEITEAINSLAEEKGVEPTAELQSLIDDKKTAEKVIEDIKKDVEERFSQDKKLDTVSKANDKPNDKGIINYGAPKTADTSKNTKKNTNTTKTNTTKTNTTKKTNTTTKKTNTTTKTNTAKKDDSKPKAKPIVKGSKINAKGAYIYSSPGGKKSKQYFASDPKYVVLSVDGNYVKVRHHSAKSGVSGWFKKSDVKAYKHGGVVDYTGLAMVHGTPREPETVLNAKDTKNFAELRDVLREISSQGLAFGDNLSSYKNMVTPQMMNLFDASKKLAELKGNSMPRENSVTFGDINIGIDHVDDYNDFVRQLQKDSKFEKMIKSITIDQLAGGSSLAKYKYNW